jgi:hypothetical protein
MHTPPNTPARFYAQMIVSYMRTLPASSAEHMVDVQMALGLSDAEFESGLRWCVERRLIDLSQGSSTHR